VSKLPCIGIILLCAVSCIDPFHPEIKETEDLLVINGSISDRPGWHYIEVSRSSPYNEPGFKPVNGCVVRVEDENGRGVTYYEYQPGVYWANLEASFLGVNKAYKLLVYTQDGEEYQSDYDSLLACPPIDSLYYEIELQESDDPNITYLGGVQFYVDVKGKEGDSRNFLWKPVESYQYHSAYLTEHVWDGKTLHNFSPRDSLRECYLTKPISEIYTASSRYLVANELHRYPLNFVSGSTPRLRIKYTLMVTQHSLSDDAFLYWDKMRTLISETGGLYEKQPASSFGNIFNINDEEEEVLGYFYASQEREKWILVKRRIPFYIPNYDCHIDTVCGDLRGLAPGSYLVRYGYGCWGYANPACFDCRLRGGSLDPPYYWPTDE
jgi:hypothetical protein